MREKKSNKRAVIVGGGFGGIRAALDLAEKKISGLKIFLFSDKDYFEYHPALYKVAMSGSPEVASIPLSDIFKGHNVEVCSERVASVDFSAKKIRTEADSEEFFDYLVLALGSETVYFNLPGLKELSFGFKSIPEANKLRRHIEELFETHTTLPREDFVPKLHFVVVGGGASGVEIAGEIAAHSAELAKKHNLDKSLVTIDLIEAAPRILPALSNQKVSDVCLHRLHDIGVNVFVNRSVVSEDIEGVYLKDMSIKSKTVIWTSGIKPNSFYKNIEGISINKNGRVAVDEFMQMNGHPDVFVIGDAADTKYAGMAQTAISDGRYVADVIEDKMDGKWPGIYKPQKTSFAIPIGEKWAAVSWSALPFLHLYGRPGWLIRRLADLRYFLSILPFHKAWRFFTQG